MFFFSGASLFQRFKFNEFENITSGVSGLWPGVKVQYTVCVFDAEVLPWLSNYILQLQCRPQKNLINKTHTMCDALELRGIYTRTCSTLLISKALDFEKTTVQQHFSTQC